MILEYFDLIKKKDFRLNKYFKIIMLIFLLFFSFCKDNYFAKNVIFRNSKCTNNKTVKIIEKDTTEYPCYKVDYEKLYVDSFTNEIIIKKYTNLNVKKNIFKKAEYIEFKDSNNKILDFEISKYIAISLTDFYNSATINNELYELNPCETSENSKIYIEVDDIYTDSNFISICYSHYICFLLGVHGKLEYKTFNFSKTSNSIITAKDYFICNQEFYDFLYKKFEKYAQNAWFEFKNIYDLDFNILENEIVFNCSNYKYASYGSGSARIKVKKSELEKFIKK